MSNKENQNVETQGQAQVNAQTTVENTPVQQNVAPQPVPQNVTAQPAEQPKKGFGGWLKEHKKGAIATVVGVVTTAFAVAEAYIQGKKAGTNSCYQQTQLNDPEYGLNPNVDE